MAYFGFIGRITLEQNPEDFKAEVISQMAKNGSEAEQRSLKRVLDDLHSFIPSRISNAKKNTLVNVYAGIVNLWAVGKIQTEGEVSKHFRKRKGKHDPQFDVLFPLADALYSFRNTQARQLQTFLKQYPGSNNPAYAKILKGISYNDALKEANGNGKNAVMPEAEFKLREIDIQNAYKQWRSRSVRK